MLEPLPAQEDGSADPPLEAPWQILTVTLSSPAVELRDKGLGTDPEDARVRTGSGDWLGLSICGEALCAEPLAVRTAADVLPDDAMPGTGLATGDKQIRQAWLAEATGRLGSWALGGPAPGTLEVLDKRRSRHRLALGMGEAFADFTPRIADLERSGEDQIIIVKADVAQGTTLAVAGLGPDGLKILAESPLEGMASSWLNPAGVADFDGDGLPDIALVRDPDGSGTLELWHYAGRQLTRTLALSGFSNHWSGAAVQNMATVVDIDDDGAADLALPSSDRRTIRVVSLKAGEIAIPARILLPAEAVSNILAFKPKGARRPQLMVGLADGTLLLAR